jgi:hypothetical protein
MGSNRVEYSVRNERAAHSRPDSHRPKREAVPAPVNEPEEKPFVPSRFKMSVHRSFYEVVDRRGKVADIYFDFYSMQPFFSGESPSPIACTLISADARQAEFVIHEGEFEGEYSVAFGAGPIFQKEARRTR